MKITAGLGSIDDYIDFVRAGVDEVFAGYVPYEWMSRVGMSTPLNRREVMFVNVQIGSESELKILGVMKKKFGVPVTITFNSPFYAPETYDIILDIIARCIDLDYHSFIVADLGLLLHINQDARIMSDPDLDIHVSGEIGEINSFLIKRLKALNIKRIIFHRKTSLTDMKSIIETMGAYDDISFEAFMLNELCHFNGGYCNTLHCDELAPICRVPYKLGNIEGLYRDNGQTDFYENDEYPEECVGSSGCGLCALWQMREAGISCLKIVSRGNYSDDTVRDIKALKKALYILDESDDEVQYIAKMKKTLYESYGGACSRNCYYGFLT